MAKKQTSAGKIADKRYKAIGVGERTSKKVATIHKSDGSTFKRKNANQFGAAEGGNDYTEDRPNRTDKFGKGSTVGNKKRFKKIEANSLRNDLHKGETPLKDYIRMYALHPDSYFVYPKDGDFKNYVYIIEPFLPNIRYAEGGEVGEIKVGDVYYLPKEKESFEFTVTKIDKGLITVNFKYPNSEKEEQVTDSIKSAKEFVEDGTWVLKERGVEYKNYIIVVPTSTKKVNGVWQVERCTLGKDDELMGGGRGGASIRMGKTEAEEKLKQIKANGTKHFGAYLYKDAYMEEVVYKQDKIKNLMYAKGGGVGKKPKMVRSVFEEEEFEYGKGGKVHTEFRGNFEYSIGGL